MGKKKRVLEAKKKKIMEALEEQALAERILRLVERSLRDGMALAASRYSDATIQVAFDAVRRDLGRVHWRVNKLYKAMGITGEDSEVGIPGYVEEGVFHFGEKVKKQRRRKVKNGDAGSIGAAEAGLAEAVKPYLRED